MILTCPECATRYFVEADRLGAGGRKVRCTSCAAEWTAEAPLELTPAPKPEPEAQVAPPPKSGVHRTFRAEVEQRRKTRRAVAAGVVWAGVAATLAIGVLGLAVFRSSVVTAFPATAGAYAFLKMPVNPTGFAIEDVQGAPTLNAGQLSVIASGALRNERDDARAAPPIRVSLYDSGGRRVASQVVLAGGARVGPGDARLFKASFVDPPGASHVQVEFAFDVRTSKAATSSRTRLPAHDPAVKAVATETAAVARAPVSAAEPVAAKPLPAGSPYALHSMPHG